VFYFQTLRWTIVQVIHAKFHKDIFFNSALYYNTFGFIKPAVEAPTVITLGQRELLCLPKNILPGAFSNLHKNDRTQDADSFKIFLTAEYYN
jgi:hypothetical protein